MPKLKVTESAEKDLKEIWEYITAKSNEESATKVLATITSKFALLRDHPGLGSRRDRLLVGLRQFNVKKYIIFYQPGDDLVEIVRIVHSSRDIKSVFERFFDSL